MAFIIKGGTATDIGISRKVNQDAIFFNSCEHKGDWFAVGAVCDGIGGLQRGEEASAIVVSGIAQWFESVKKWLDISSVDTEVLYSHLKDAAEQWNGEVLSYCIKNNIKSGTTMSIIMIIRDRFYILQVGDSRIYRCRGGMEQLTVDAAVIRICGGRTKKFLNNYMGKENQLWYTTVEGEIKSGDIYLFCSDGFYHKLTQDDAEGFARQIRDNQPIDGICRKAIYEMESRRETDNISAGLISVSSKDGKIRKSD